MSRSVLLVFGSSLGLAVCALASACRKGPTYDDAPITRDDRPKVSKIEKVDYDRDKVCKRLAATSGTKVMPEDQAAELHEMCLRELLALKGRDRAEFDCRCKCVMAAPDLASMELCQRRCVLERLDVVCEHAVGSQEKSNDGKVVDAARKACLDRLKTLRTKDEPRYDCTIRCLMLADGKGASLLCDDRCDPTKAPEIFDDAGTDAP